MRFSCSNLLHVAPLLLVSFLLSSCGGGGGGGSNASSSGSSTTPSAAAGASKSLAYVMNAASISAFRIDGSTGNLTFVGALLQGAGSENVRMAVHPSDKFAYVTHMVADPVTNFSHGDVTAYRINADGTFTAAGTPVAMEVACCVTVHPSGNFLYVMTATFKPDPISSQNDTTDYAVVTYAINASTGALSLVGESSSPFTLFSQISQPIDIVIEPSGRFAYIRIQGFKPGSNDIRTYTINSVNGLLTPVAIPNQWQTVFVDAMTTHPSGKFAYVAFLFDPLFSNTPPGTAAIQAYSIADTGALTAAGTPVTGIFNAFSVVVEPGGRFLYAADLSTSDVSGYIIDSATGTLTSMGPAVAAGLPGVRSISVEPGGKYVYALNSSTANIYAYAINPVTGSLTPSGDPVPTLPNALSMTTAQTSN